MRLNLTKKERYTLKVTITPNMLETIKGDKEKGIKDIAASYVAHQLHKDFDLSKEEMTLIARKELEERATLSFCTDGSVEVTLIMETDIELADISEYKSKKMVNMKEI